MKQLGSYVLIAIVSSVVTVVAIDFFPHLQRASTNPDAKSKTTHNALLPAPPDINTLLQDNNELQQQLTQTHQTIATLEQEIAWLQSIIEQIDAGNDSTPDKKVQPPNTQQLWFDEEALLNAGFSTQEVMNLKERVEAHTLELLDLRNRGIREGWGRGGKLFKELRELEQRFQASFTPQEYDAVLYASGKNNRVEVTDTLGNSAAEYAGIRTGDIILSYDGEKILELAPLHQLTAKGDNGEMVAIRLLRKGEIITVYAPRGTLGTRLKLTRAKPEPY